MTVQRQYIALGGGIDTETPVLSVPPGFVREAWNFEQSVDGGYSRIGGFERFDGRPAPSAATGATDEEVAIEREARRAAITAVPGSGPVRGVAKFGGSTYAFRDTADTTAKKMYRATVSGWAEVTTPALQPGGNLRTVIYDFGDGDKLFGCDGANKAFMFDGTTYTEITTGNTPDNPRHLAAHQNHLFLSFVASLQHSAIGDPTDWTALGGAGEINVGAPITNLAPQPGSQGTGALAVSTDQSLFVLYGTSAQDWNLATLQSEVGAREGSMQNIGVAFMLSEMGVTIIGQSQEYGNFAHSVVSHRAKSWLKQFGASLTTSSTHREKNQYRLFFGSRGLFITVRGREVVGMMPIDYGVPVSCCTTTNDDTFLFGSDNGFVYQGDIGTSFDGEDIASALVFPFNSNKSIRQRKRYRRLIVELDADRAVSMQASFTLSYGDFEVGFAAKDLTQSGLPASLWDVAYWDIDFWDGGATPVARVDLEGVGENISVALSHVGAEDPAFAIRSFILEFSPRRGER